MNTVDFRGIQQHPTDSAWTSTPLFRLKVTLGDNYLEVEGTEQLVRDVSDGFNKMVMLRWLPSQSKAAPSEGKGT